MLLVLVGLVFLIGVVVGYCMSAGFLPGLVLLIPGFFLLGAIDITTNRVEYTIDTPTNKVYHLSVSGYCQPVTTFTGVVK